MARAIEASAGPGAHLFRDGPAITTMPSHIGHLIPADGWYAVFARPAGTARSSGAAGPHRSSGPVPDFLPLVAWAVIADKAGSGPDHVIGIVVHGDQQPEVVDTGDPSFLGYAGPGDPAIDRNRPTPDWRALAKQALTALKSQR